MKPRFHVIASIAIALAAAQAAPAPQATPVAPPAAAGLDPAALDKLISEHVDSRGLVGLSVALAKDGKTVLAKGYGKAALAPSAIATVETPFAIGSITKQFTSACVLLLAEDGKLSVKDKVAKYYPSLTRAADITLLDLMNHVSGYPDYYPLDFVDRRMLAPISPDELVRQYAGGKLDFEPGSRYSYSNTGFVLLGRIVEKVSGRPFGAFLKERILNPLKLRNTHFEPSPKPVSEDRPGLARGYTTFALSGPEPATPEATGWIDAAGAIYATAADLAAWDLALVSGKVLQPASYALMTTPRTLSDGRISSYGCGLSLGTRNGRPLLSHNGAVAGFYALNTVIPSLRGAVVILSNFDSYDAVNALNSRLLAALFPAEAPYVPAVSGPSAVEAHRAMLKAFQAGAVDRSLLGAEFDWYLTAGRLRGASARLKPYGDPARAELESASERGGMEVSRVRFVFDKAVLHGLMYRTPDGKIQQFFVSKD